MKTKESIVREMITVNGLRAVLVLLMAGFSLNCMYIFHEPDVQVSTANYHVETPETVLKGKMAFGFAGGLSSPYYTFYWPAWWIHYGLSPRLNIGFHAWSGIGGRMEAKYAFTSFLAFGSGLGIGVEPGWKYSFVCSEVSCYAMVPIKTIRSYGVIRMNIGSVASHYEMDYTYCDPSFALGLNAVGADDHIRIYAEICQIIHIIKNVNTYKRNSYAFGIQLGY